MNNGSYSGNRHNDHSLIHEEEQHFSMAGCIVKDSRRSSMEVTTDDWFRLRKKLTPLRLAMTMAHRTTSMLVEDVEASAKKRKKKKKKKKNITNTSTAITAAAAACGDNDMATSKPPSLPPPACGGKSKATCAARKKRKARRASEALKKKAPAAASAATAASTKDDAATATDTEHVVEQDSVAVLTLDDFDQMDNDLPPYDLLSGGMLNLLLDDTERLVQLQEEYIDEDELGPETSNQLISRIQHNLLYLATLAERSPHFPDVQREHIKRWKNVGNATTSTPNNETVDAAAAAAAAADDDDDDDDDGRNIEEVKEYFGDCLSEESDIEVEELDDDDEVEDLSDD